MRFQDLGILNVPANMFDLWSQWRKINVPQSVRIEWDLYVMATVWLVWHERNSRIFLQKSKTNSSVLAFTYSFVVFCLENMPPKQWRTFVNRKGPKGVAGQSALQSHQEEVAASVEEEPQLNEA